MDRIFMILKLRLTLVIHLSLHLGYIHVYDHHSQTSFKLLVYIPDLRQVVTGHCISGFCDPGTIGSQVYFCKRLHKAWHHKDSWSISILAILLLWCILSSSRGNPKHFLELSQGISFKLLQHRMWQTYCIHTMAGTWTCDKKKNTLIASIFVIWNSLANYLAILVIWNSLANYLAILVIWNSLANYLAILVIWNSLANYLAILVIWNSLANYMYLVSE